MSTGRFGFRFSFGFIGVIIALAVLGSAGILANQYVRPLPPVSTQVVLAAERQVGAQPSLPWPTKGSSAVWVEGFGFLGAQGDTSPRPIASTAKIMTALLTLEDHPLALGQAGPEVAITQQDVADYQKAISEDQSAVPVRAGGKLTELQLVQGLLLPSGNNMADILAKWDAGSTQAFVAKMNARAAALGMSRTHYDDASGFSAKTVSTPSDLLIVSAKAMTDQVFRHTVATAQATLPVAGVVSNVNTSLGKDGNIGIKTGTTDEAGGCFVSASVQQVAGKPMEIYSAVLGQDHRDDALAATAALSKAAATAFQQTRVLNKTDVAATLSTAWGEPVQVMPSQDVDMLAWPGTTLKANVQLDSIQAPVPAGTKVGAVTIELGKQTQSVDLLTSAPIVEPTWQWRATRFLRHD